MTITLIEARDEVRRLIRRRPFHAIEEQIDRYEDLNPEQRSALWLYAWHLAGRGVQRRTVKQALVWAGAAESPGPRAGD